MPVKVTSKLLRRAQPSQRQVTPYLSFGNVTYVYRRYTKYRNNEKYTDKKTDQARSIYRSERKKRAE